jgi:hypothetical protein
MAFIREQQLLKDHVFLPGDLVEFAGEDALGEPTFTFKSRHWREMSLAELRGVRDMAENLYHRGRANSEATRAAEDEVNKKLSDGVRENTRARKPRGTKLARETNENLTENTEKHGFYWEHRKLESILLQLDGFVTFGPMYNAIFAGLARGRATKVVFIEMLQKQIDSALGRYSRKERQLIGDEKSAVAIEGLGGAMLTREARLMLAANWGNESSREAVLADEDFIGNYGEAWNEETIQEILDTLTTTDLDILEDMWAMVNQFWDDIVTRDGKVPGIASTEKEFTGVAPPKVEASPFTVNGREMSGAYYPLNYDGRLNSRVAIERQQDIIDANIAGGFSRAHTRHQHTTARVGSGGRPVMLAINTLFGHLEQVTHDLAFRRPIHDASKVITNKDVRDAIVETIGQTGYDTIVKLLVKVSKSLAPEDLSSGDRKLRTARLNVAAAIMGGNIRVILTQWLGLFQSASEIGSGRVLQGMAEFWLNPNAVIREIEEASAFMRERRRTMLRDLNEMASSLGIKTLKQRAQLAGFWPIVIADVYLVSYPTWIAAKRKAVAGKVDGVNANDEAAANEYADLVVRRSQGAGDQENLSLIQQKDEFWRAATMFGGYFNTTMNLESEAIEQALLLGEQGKKLKGSGSLIYKTTLLQLLPAVMAGLMLEPLPSDKDEDEHGEAAAWARWMAIQLLNHTGAQVFILRDIIQASTGFFGFSLSPVESLGSSAGKAVKELVNIPKYVEEGELPAKAVKNIARFVLTYKGVPYTSTSIRFGDTAYKMAEGKLKNEPKHLGEAMKKLLLTGDR